MSEYSEKVQSLMDAFYDEWQKEDNAGKGKWDVLAGLTPAHQIAVTFGNFNYQVENGGISQWIYNRYFYDDADKLIDYLTIGAESDERCQVILEKISALAQHAHETGCDQYGDYTDPGDEDGENGFIGDLIDGDKFDTWYYKHCDGDDWWQTVCGVIDNAGTLEQARQGLPVADAPLGAEDCVPNGMDTDLKGKVVAIRADALLPEYRACSHQLALATGGFGCSPEARGRAVFTTALNSGDKERWDRGDILGVIAEDTLPGWAQEKLAALRQPPEKESVIAKIREAKNNPSAPKEGQRQKKEHEPEL